MKKNDFEVLVDKFKNLFKRRTALKLWKQNKTLRDWYCQREIDLEGTKKKLEIDTLIMEFNQFINLVGNETVLIGIYSNSRLFRFFSSTGDFDEVSRVSTEDLMKFLDRAIVCDHKKLLVRMLTDSICRLLKGENVSFCNNRNFTRQLTEDARTVILIKLKNAYPDLYSRYFLHDAAWKRLKNPIMAEEVRTAMQVIDPEIVDVITATQVVDPVLIDVVTGTKAIDPIILEDAMTPTRVIDLTIPEAAVTPTQVVDLTITEDVVTPQAHNPQVRSWNSLVSYFNVPVIPVMRPYHPFVNQTPVACITTPVQIIQNTQVSHYSMDPPLHPYNVQREIQYSPMQEYRLSSKRILNNSDQSNKRIFSTNTDRTLSVNGNKEQWQRPFSSALFDTAIKEGNDRLIKEYKDDHSNVLNYFKILLSSLNRNLIAHMWKDNELLKNKINLISTYQESFELLEMVGKVKDSNLFKAYVNCLYNVKFLKQCLQSLGNKCPNITQLIESRLIELQGFSRQGFFKPQQSLVFENPWTPSAPSQEEVFLNSLLNC